MVNQELLKAAMEIAADLGIDTTMRRLVRSARSLVQADSVVLQFSDGADRRTITATHDSQEPLAIHDDGGVPAPGAAGREAREGVPELTAPLLVRGREYGRLHVTGKSGGSFTEEDRVAVACLASAGTVAIANSLQFDSMRHWLHASIGLSLPLPSKSQDVRDRIVNQAMYPSSAALAAMVSPAADGAFARCEAAAGGRARMMLRKVLPLTWSVAADVLAAGRPRVCQTEELVGEDSSDGLGEALLAPLPRGGEPSMLVLFRELGAEPFRQLDLEMAGVFCTHAAMAMELAQGQRLREQLMLFADRDRIARDLHDVVIQRLFAAGLSIQSLRRFTGDETAHQRISSVTLELDEAIRELRDTIYSLHAEPEELSSRLVRAVQDGTDSHYAKPRLEIAGPVDRAVPPSVADHLLAVATEGVSNAVRHSGAKTIDVSVAVKAGTVHLVIQDDGRGFAETVRRSGLANLEQRALDLNGTFEVLSAPGQGTRISWSVPLPHDEPSKR